MSDPQPTLTKTKTRTKTVTAVLLIVLGAGILFAFASHRGRSRSRPYTRSAPVSVHLGVPTPVAGTPEITPTTPSVTSENSTAGWCDNLDDPDDTGSIVGGCNDALDNDGDGLTDASDPDCADPCDGLDNNNILCADEGCATPGNLLDLEAGGCNNLDDDGDGLVDEGCDRDNDGFCRTTLAFASSYTCPRGSDDCADNNAAVNPGTPENCATTLVDDNCNGVVNEGC